MRKSKLVKLVARYGLYSRNKVYKLYANETYYCGSDILVDYNSECFVGKTCESDGYEDYLGDDLFSHETFYFDDYGSRWVLMRKKDIIKKYGELKHYPQFCDEVKARKEQIKKAEQKRKQRAKENKRKETQNDL